MPFWYPVGGLPASSEEVRFCVVVRARGGLLVDGREYYDSATLLSQLGLLSRSAEAGD